MTFAIAPRSPVRTRSGKGSNGEDMSENASEASGSSGGAPAPAPKTSGGRKFFYAIAGTAAAAILGATASALITPERFDAIFGTSGKSETAVSTSSPSPTPFHVQTKTISTQDGALSVKVPAAWPARDARFSDSTVVGTAVFSGTDVTTGITFTDDGVWIGASFDLADRELLSSLDREAREAVANRYANEFDWASEGCIVSHEPARTKDGWLIVTKHWVDCAATEGFKLWEIAALNDAGTIMVRSQIALTPGAPVEIVDYVVSSFAVDESRLPR